MALWPDGCSAIVAWIPGTADVPEIDHTQPIQPP
jgi:hypothetical protein